MGKAALTDAYEELLEPLSLALGQLVIAAAVLENALVADLIQRRVVRDGADQVFGKGLVSRLEQMPAGALLEKLRGLEYDDQLAEDIAAAIAARNHFIHHLFEDPEFISAMATGERVGLIVARVEAAVAGLHAVIARLAPEMISGLQVLFGASTPELLDVIKGLDPAEFGDGPERRQLEALQSLPRGMVEGDGLFPQRPRPQPKPPT